ncbi:MAG: hypothetical protein EBR82_00620 [Caulobacteraceae bacterium]|nr:hypothetical protein [Caulobacteraceae bacterium]
MKITVNQLRRIIKEEVKRSLLREMEEEADASFEIPEISVRAEGADMSVHEFVGMVKGMAKKYKSITFEPANALDKGDGYSAEYDSLLSYGSRSELKSLARDLDEELMGGAQSISDEDSFTNYVYSA